MIDSNYIQTILEAPVYQRLRDWYNIGPVQRATLDEFVEEVVTECFMILEMKHGLQVRPQLKAHWKIRQDEPQQ